jgi:hypothetical protein
VLDGGIVIRYWHTISTLAGNLAPIILSLSLRLHTKFSDRF